MSSYEVLFHPTYPVEAQSKCTKRDAVSLGTRLLKENGMAEMEAYEEDTTETSRYFLCSYRNALDPDLAYGGNAALVVRKSDFLCGMVHCRTDWMDPDKYDYYAQIDRAFKKFDGISETENR